MSDRIRGDRFTWTAKDIPVSQCMLCRHLDQKAANALCAAFPGQIPQAILSNEVDHRRPWIDPETGRPGDQGIALAASITFEPRPGVAPEALDRLYRYMDQL